MKITLNEFIEQSSQHLGRKLNEDEVASIQPCDCGSSVCSGWTAKFDLEPILSIMHSPRAIEL